MTIESEERGIDAEEAVRKSIDLIERYGGIDGAHHKQWLLDQIVRTLTGARYDAWLVDYAAGEDGPDTYEWEEGIAP